MRNPATKIEKILSSFPIVLYVVVACVAVRIELLDALVAHVPVRHFHTQNNPSCAAAAILYLAG
jgi:hypothetical protein